MKRVLLSVLVLGALAGPASADLYVLDVATAVQLRAVSFSDPDGSLDWVGYNDGTPVGIPQKGVRVDGDDDQYGTRMQLSVGFAGTLTADLDDGDSYASVFIGAAGTPALTTIRTAGLRTRFSLPLANDNDDLWDYALYYVLGSERRQSPMWTTLAAGDRAVLTWQFDSAVNFADLDDLGFVIRGDFSGDNPSNPDFFHTSIVPVPGALGLGLLGLGAAGTKLRRDAGKERT